MTWIDLRPLGERDQTAAIGGDWRPWRGRVEWQPGYDHQRPLRAGEMRTCDHCGGAQLGPGPWGYAGPICMCVRRVLPVTHLPDGSPVDHVTVPASPPWWHHYQKPRIRVKAGSRRYP